jgi:hypothetical protein
MMSGLLFDIPANRLQPHFANAAREIAAGPQRRQSLHLKIPFARSICLQCLNAFRDGLIRFETHETSELIGIRLVIEQVQVMATTDFVDDVDEWVLVLKDLMSAMGRENKGSS